MQFTTSILSLLSLTSLALGLPSEKRQAAALCSGTTVNPQCCATDVLGLADLNCFNPPRSPTDTADFTAACASVGQEAKCCALPILGQALICESPI